MPHARGIAPFPHTHAWAPPSPPPAQNSITQINANKSGAPGNGAFLTSCHTHCEAQGGGFDTFQVNGVSMMQAVSTWMAANANPSAPPAPSAAHTLVDCFYTVEGKHVCNSHC